MVDRRGFTLIEVIVALLVSAIILTALSTMIYFVLNASKHEEAYVRVQEGLRSAGVSIERDIRGSSQQFTLDASGQCISIVDHSDFIHYCFDGSSLYRNERLITGDITAFSLEAVDGGIMIRLEGDFEGRIIIYEQTLYLRSGGG